MKQMELSSKFLNDELILFRNAKKSGDHNLCLKHLGRAHIISQKSWKTHFYVHCLMLQYAFIRSDIKEIQGQLLRMAATVPGNLFKKLPIGNTGWSSVGMLEHMSIPEDLKILFLE